MCRHCLGNRTSSAVSSPSLCLSVVDPSRLTRLLCAAYSVGAKGVPVLKKRGGKGEDVSAVLRCRQGRTLEGVRDSFIVSGSVLPWLCHYGSSSVCAVL